MIRIQSWNIAQSLEKSLPYLKQWNADICCLLECGSEPELRALSAGKQLSYLHDQYNMALISSFPINKFEEIRDPSLGKPILFCEITIHTQVVRIFVVHLTMPLNNNDKQKQHLQEIAFLKQIASANTTSSIIIGDLNARSVLDAETDYTAATDMLTARGFVDSAAYAQTPGFLATKIDRSNCGKRIDYCFLSPDLAATCTAYGVHNTTASISDHRAIWVDLDIPAATEN